VKADVGASVGKARPVLTVVAEDGARREGVSLLDDIVREGARRMLTAALEAEVDAYLAELACERPIDRCFRHRPGRRLHPLVSDLFHTDQRQPRRQHDRAPQLRTGRDGPAVPLSTWRRTCRHCSRHRGSPQTGLYDQHRPGQAAPEPTEAYGHGTPLCQALVGSGVLG
jgi:hypothetical protein